MVEKRRTASRYEAARKRRHWRGLGLDLSAAAVIASLAALGGGAGAVEAVSGPVPAQVLKVIDGDTIVVRARIWIGQDVETRVRLAGVDAPELHGACSRERALAAAAQRFVVETLGGKAVTLSEVRHDKFGGRVLARVRTAAGDDLGAALVAADLARPYDGGARRVWCEGGAPSP